MGNCAVAAFYRFQPLRDVGRLVEAVEVACAARGLKGTVLLAPEGVNGALAGRREDVEAMLAEFFPTVRVNWSCAASPDAAFRRLKVRAKAEVVTFGESLAGQPVGEHVDAEVWNALLADPDVRVVDVRNSYETELGTFDGATPLETATFGEFREAVRAGLCGDGHQPVAMYCTGGIRCEKASAYLLAQGFEQVYQLDGGILGYLGKCAADAGEHAPVNRFEGECFVFDGRVALAADLAPGSHRLCAACGATPTKAADGRCSGCASGGRPAAGA